MTHREGVRERARDITEDGVIHRDVLERLIAGVGDGDRVGDLVADLRRRSAGLRHVDRRLVDDVGVAGVRVADLLAGVNPAPLGRDLVVHRVDVLGREGVVEAPGDASSHRECVGERTRDITEDRVINGHALERLVPGVGDGDLPGDLVADLGRRSAGLAHVDAGLVDDVRVAGVRVGDVLGRVDPRCGRGDDVVDRIGCLIGDRVLEISRGRSTHRQGVGERPSNGSEERVTHIYVLERFVPRVLYRDLEGDLIADLGVGGAGLGHLYARVVGDVGRARVAVCDRVTGLGALGARGDDVQQRIGVAGLDRVTEALRHGRVDGQGARE